MSEPAALAALINRALSKLSPVIEGPQESLNAASLAPMAASIEAILRAGGIESEEPVHVTIGNRPRDLAALLGIWQAGGVAVPVHVATPQAVRTGLQARTGARFSVDGAAVGHIGVKPPVSRPLLHDAALIVFTSGSTGEPKGVVIGHTRLAGKLDVLTQLIQPHQDDIVLLPLQLTFIFGIWVSLLTLIAGARLRLMPRFSLGAARAELAAGVSMIACVPTMLRTLVNGPRLEAPSLRAILTGGEPLGAALAAATTTALPRAALFDLYGLTETGSCDFCLHPQDQPAGFGAIGRPTENVTFRLAAWEGAPADAATGELQIKTPFGMLGYLDQPDLTAASFVDHYFRTGDLARLRADGLLELIGRAKEIISRAGHKIAPLEIEALLAGHPDVAAVLCAGVPDEETGERIHVVVVPRPHTTVTAEALRTWAATRIERYKLPDAIHIQESLPTGRTGKADRGALARLLSAP
jgi:acyl-CoA synthetase (AMP-forming)/AMP-acid ligase II